GRSVEHASDGLHVAEVFVVSDVLRAGEQHVLEEMRETGAAGALVLRADVIPEIDGDERSGMVLVQDDRQSVTGFVSREVPHSARSCRFYSRDTFRSGASRDATCSPR